MSGACRQQLSEGDLFLWGRDVSIRNRKQILKLVSQIKNLQQHLSTTRSSIDVHGADSQPPTTNNDDIGDDPEDDFTDEEDEEVRPVQDDNVQDLHSSIRPPFPTPRNQGIKQQQEGEEDPYLTPIEPSFKDNHPGPQSKGLHGSHPPPYRSPTSKVGPCNTTRQHNVPKTMGSGSILPPRPGEHRPPPLPSRVKGSAQGPTPLPGSGRGTAQLRGCEWGPAKLPHHFTATQNKQTTSEPLLPPSRPTNLPPFQRRNNSQTVTSENAASGAVGGSFLHRSHQQSKPMIPWSNESACKTSCPQEENEHLYETMETPVALSGFQGLESSHSSVPDFDDTGLSSQLGAASLFHKKKAPIVSQKHSGDDTVLVPPPSSSPRQLGRNRQHNSRETHPLPVTQKTSPQEPQAPHVPKENLPYINLDDGQVLVLTPLYQNILDKPYFHIISRAKAKTLMMYGEDGTFLIRPSTRSADPLTLTVKVDKRHYNINIRQRPDLLFALGKQKTPEKAFSSIDDIITTYTQEPIKLENGREAVLKQTPSKNTTVYVKHYPTARGKKTSNVHN